MEPKKRLGELLLEAGVIDDTQLQSALGHQRRWGMKLGQALLDLKLATEPQIVTALSRKFGYEVANLAAIQVGPMLESAMKLVPREVAEKHTLLPLAADTNSITVAMSDPTNIAVVDELSFRTGRRVKISIAGERELATTVRRLYFGDEARKGPEPIALDESDVQMETTSDPFSAIPDHLREGYTGRPAGQPASWPAQTPPPTLRPATGTQTPSFRPAPPPPVAAPPLPQPASYRPPQAPGRSPTPGGGIGMLPANAVVVDMSDLTSAAEPGRRPAGREGSLAEVIAALARESAAAGGAAASVAAALARVLVRKGYLSESELLDELRKK